MLRRGFSLARWVGGNVPVAAVCSALALPSLARKTQSPHHAHDQPGPMVRSRGGVFSLEPDPFLMMRWHALLMKKLC
jgi:hypothetical protein